jgi:hypothetical protein
VEEESLEELFSAGLDSRILRAGHNYYPRPETGLSFELFFRRSMLFHRHGVPVSAFIPSRANSRGPVFAGLPTLESHRKMNPVDAARQLWTSGAVDEILFGDPLATAEELQAISLLARNHSGPVEMVIRKEALSAVEQTIVLAPLHTNRLDAAEAAVRSQEARGMCTGPIIPQAPRQRHRGDVTLDNSNYGRYMGELQIVLRPLPADERVNVVGRVDEKDICLLDCLTPGRTFHLKEAQSSAF